MDVTLTCLYDDNLTLLDAFSIEMEKQKFCYTFDTVHQHDVYWPDDRANDFFAQIFVHSLNSQIFCQNVLIDAPLMNVIH